MTVDQDVFVEILGSMELAGGDGAHRSLLSLCDEPRDYIQRHRHLQQEGRTTCPESISTVVVYDTFLRLVLSPQRSLVFADGDI